MIVSIITINYNNTCGLRRTLESVVNQTWKEYELVIVDGGSSDGSNDIINEYSKTHPNLIWVSEADTGIYNAMNKGVKMAHGEYCLFLNSGDCFFADETLKICADYLDGNIQIISGGVKTDTFSRYAPEAQELSLAYFIKESMNHQSTFIKRDLLLDIPYNEKRDIAADSEFFFDALILRNSSYHNIPVWVSYCEAAGKSGDLEKSMNERLEAIKDLLPKRMAYDVDFIKKYHNSFVLCIGDIFYKKWIRTLFFRYNQLRKRFSR